MTNDYTDGYADVQGRRRSRTRRCQRKGYVFFICFLTTFAVIAGLLVTRNGASLFSTCQAESPSIAQEDNPPTDDEKYETDIAGWNLVLVNRWNPLPDQYEIELVELPGGESVDARIYSALQEMFEAMQADGVYPVVVSGYRTIGDQQRIMDERITQYQAQGYSYEEAQAEAEVWVAIPGTSEHQLGLAVDINADGIHSAGYEVYDWLNENSYQYGFVQRYPSDKTEITGIGNEPWHYRYVGVEAATDMKAKGLCLEEYLESTEESEC